MIEKIMSGYRLAKIDINSTDTKGDPFEKYNGKTFSEYHKKLCEDIFSSNLSKAGGVLAFMKHPIDGYKAIAKYKEFH